MKKRAASFLLALALLVQLLPVSALATEVTEGAVSGTEEAAAGATTEGTDPGTEGPPAPAEEEVPSGTDGAAVTAPSENAADAGESAAEGGNFCGGADGSGENATWSFDAASRTLTISGTGEAGSCDDWKSLGNINTVEIGEGITSVGAIFSWWDYWNTPSVGTLKLPASLTSLDPGAFAYGGLWKIIVAEGNQHYASRDGVLFSGDGKVLCKYPADRSGTSYTVPDGVERLETNAFSYCDTLAEVHLPEGLKTIGSTVFFASNYIAQIDLPASVTTLEDSAFAQSSCNISIHPDSRLETIGNYVFQGNYSITSLTLPSTLQSVGERTFPESKGDFSGLTILSRNVVIDASNADLLRGFPIIGYSGSTVETFANENGLTFVDIDRAALTGAGKTVGWLYGDRGANEPNYAAEGAQRNITIPAGQSDLTLSLICGIDSTFGEEVILNKLEFTMRIPDALGAPVFALGDKAGAGAAVSATPDPDSSGYGETVYTVKVSGAQFADGDVALKCTFQGVSPQWYSVGGIYNVMATYQQVAETGTPVEPATVWHDLYLHVLEFQAGEPTTAKLMPGGIDTSSSHLFAGGWQRGNHLLMTENGCDVVYQTVDSPASLSLQLTPGANQQYYKQTTISLYRSDTAEDAAGRTPLCTDIVYEDGASYATMDALTKAHPITQILPADTAGSYYVTAVVRTLYAAGSSSEEKTETAVVKVTTLEKNENLYGTTVDGKTVVGYAGSESVMTLPAQIDETPVKSISPLADGVQHGTTEVVVSEGIENLLDNAFANFKDAQRITLPKTIKSVGANALSTGGGELTLRIESMDAQDPTFAENAVDLTHTHLTVECYGESAAYAWASGLKTQASDKVTIVRLDDTDTLRLEVKNKEGISLGVDAFSEVEWFRKGSDQPIYQDSTSYTPPEGEEISEDTPYICRVTFQTATRAAYLVPAQMDILFTQRGTKTVVLQPRNKTVTLKGKFIPSEINTSEFSAILTIKDPSSPNGEMESNLTVDTTTGEFTYEMDKFFLADLTADNGQGRRLTLYDVQSRGADENGVVDLGEIKLPDRAFRRTVYSEDYANFTEYSAIRNLFYYGNSVSVLTDQNGAEVPRTDYAIVPSSSWTSVGDSVYYKARFKILFGDAFAERYAVGDRFTLKMDGTQPRYDMTPVEFTLQSVDEDVAYLNPTFETLAYFNGAYGTNHFLFKEGESELYRATTISGRGFHVAAGTYTLISIRDNPYINQIDHLGALEELGIEPQYYSKKTVVLEGGKDYNAQSAPEFMENTITLTAEAGAAQQFGGMVPIYIHYYDQLAEEFGRTSSAKISLYTNDSASSDGSLPLYRINDRYAFSADSDVTEEVSLTPGSWHSERLDLSVSGASSADLVLYAKPTGRYLYIQASNDANETIARAALELPRQSISLADVKSIDSEESGNLHLYTILKPETGETFSAKLYIDGAFVREFPDLQTSGTGENLIPYTLTRYRDGAASHSIQVEVWRNKAGGDPECLWTSGPQPVLLLAEGQDAPSPQKLYIRMTSVNKNGTASVKAQKTLDLVNGRYGDLSYTTYPWELNTDNTFNVDMVFDYQLTMEHPDLVRNGRVTMKIYSGKEKKPDITNLTLMRNPVTGTFDGTLTLPAGTCTLADIPFGYDLIYYDDGAAASLSMDQVIGQVQAGLERRQELMTSEVPPEDMLSMTPVDMELLEYILGDTDEGLTEEEKQRVRDIYAAYNELCRTYEEGVSAVKDALKDSAETMGYEGELKNEEDLINFLNSIAHNEMKLAQLTQEELPSAEELLNNGCRRVPGSDIYVYADSISRQTSVIDLESGTWCGNGAAPQLMTFSLGGEVVDMMMVFNEYYSTAMTLLDVVLERAEEIIEAYEKLARTYLLDEVMADAKIRKKLEEHTAYFDLKKMADLNEIEHLREQIRTARLNVQAARTFDVAAIQKAKTALAPLTQMKAVRLLQKLPIGNIMGVVGLISDVITLMETSEYQYNKVKSLDGEIKLAESYLARIKRAVASGCLGDDATAFQAVAECERRVEELCEDARDAQDWVLSFMVSRIAVFVADMTGTALQFVGAARVSLVLGTVSFAAGNVSELGCRMGIELNQKAVDEAWPDVIDACLKPIEKGECEEGEQAEEDGSDDEEDENKPLRPSIPGGDGSGDGSGDGGIGGVSRPEISMPFVPRIDPAGYVYEAVASNRISGATATAYYRNGSDEAKWDAEEADQENPLTTDEEGRYSWFTPPGDWLVKVTKDGYLPADSKNDPAAVDGWLPVPPPQINVNIGLMSTAAPSVESCAAAADRVRVVFSQYMDAAHLRDGSLVSVTQNGSVVPVAVSFEDAEESPTRPGTMYGRVMKLTRSDGQNFVGSIVVHIKQAAKNYAANEMTADYTSAPLTVGALVGSIEHSYPNRFVTEINGSGTIAVQVVDTAGNPMPGVTVTARQAMGGTLEFSTSAVSDSNGRAVFSYRGRSSGYDTLIFTADTVSTEMQTRVAAMDTSAPAKPTANLSDYAVVTKGTQLIISAQEGAIIRYTTDDTCPCTDAALTYTGPITLTKSGFYRIAAWTQSGGYSERLNLHITVTDAQPPSGESSGGGGSTAFGVTTDKPKNGAITVSPKYASKGDIVTITVTPDEDYELDTLRVTDKNGDQIKVTEKSDGKFIFTMPGSRVSVEAWFKRAGGGSEVPAFVDVPADAYYADAVTWAVEQGITAGTSATTFSPNVSCTRAQMVTFLWRANGSPKATAANSFTDVSADSYYYDAVLWAAEKGITAGTSATTFSPDATLTRSQAVTFLYRAAGSPAASNSSFNDVAADAYYANAVSWAVSEGVTAGTGGNNFSPNADCTRAQIVTFLYRSAQ